MATLIKNNALHVFSDENELYTFAAHDFSQRAQVAVQEQGVFTVALSGGNTPKAFFDVLAKQQDIPWHNIKFFFGDERYVSAESSESNYHMANQHLFSKVPVLAKHIFRIPTHFSNPEEAANEYESTLRKELSLDNDNIPQFDLIYLGLGDDAHTASLMPGSEIVEHFTSGNKKPFVASLFVPKLNMYRITLTPPIINHAKTIIFLVTGAGKAQALQQVLEDEPQPQLLPAQLIGAVQGKTIWYIDRAAANNLEKTITD